MIWLTLSSLWRASTFDLLIVAIVTDGVKKGAGKHQTACIERSASHPAGVSWWVCTLGAGRSAGHSAGVSWWVCALGAGRSAGHPAGVCGWLCVLGAGRSAGHPAGVSWWAVCIGRRAQRWSYGDAFVTRRPTLADRIVFRAGNCLHLPCPPLTIALAFPPTKATSRSVEDSIHER